MDTGDSEAALRIGPWVEPAHGQPGSSACLLVVLPVLPGEVVSQVEAERVAVHETQDLFAPILNRTTRTNWVVFGHKNL